jgi:hypothetical protein
VLPVLTRLFAVSIPARMFFTPCDLPPHVPTHHCSNRRAANRGLQAATADLQNTLCSLWAALPSADWLPLLQYQISRFVRVLHQRSVLPVALRVRVAHRSAL